VVAPMSRLVADRPRSALSRRCTRGHAALDFTCCLACLAPGGGPSGLIGDMSPAPCFHTHHAKRISTPSQRLCASAPARRRTASPSSSPMLAFTSIWETPSGTRGCRPVPSLVRSRRLIGTGGRDAASQRGQPQHRLHRPGQVQPAALGGRRAAAGVPASRSAPLLPNDGPRGFAVRLHAADSDSRARLRRGGVRLVAWPRALQCRRPSFRPPFHRLRQRWIRLGCV